MDAAVQAATDKEASDSSVQRSDSAIQEKLSSPSQDQPPQQQQQQQQHTQQPSIHNQQQYGGGNGSGSNDSYPSSSPTPPPYQQMYPRPYSQSYGQLPLQAQRQQYPRRRNPYFQQNGEFPSPPIQHAGPWEHMHSPNDGSMPMPYAVSPTHMQMSFSPSFAPGSGNAGYPPHGGFSPANRSPSRGSGRGRGYGSPYERNASTRGGGSAGGYQRMSGSASYGSLHTMASNPMPTGAMSSHPFPYHPNMPSPQQMQLSMSSMSPHGAPILIPLQHMQLSMGMQFPAGMPPNMSAPHAMLQPGQSFAPFQPVQHPETQQQPLSEVAGSNSSVVSGYPTQPLVLAPISLPLQSMPNTIQQQQPDASSAPASATSTLNAQQPTGEAISSAEAGMDAQPGHMQPSLASPVMYAPISLAWMNGDSSIAAAQQMQLQHHLQLLALHHHQQLQMQAQQQQQVLSGDTTQAPSGNNDMMMEGSVPVDADAQSKRSSISEPRSTRDDSDSIATASANNAETSAQSQSSISKSSSPVVENTAHGGTENTHNETNSSTLSLSASLPPPKDQLLATVEVVHTSVALENRDVDESRSSVPLRALANVTLSIHIQQNTYLPDAEQTPSTLEKNAIIDTTEVAEHETKASQWILRLYARECKLSDPISQSPPATVDELLDKTKMGDNTSNSNKGTDRNHSSDPFSQFSHLKLLAEHADPVTFPFVTAGDTLPPDCVTVQLVEIPVLPGRRYDSILVAAKYDRVSGKVNTACPARALSVCGAPLLVTPPCAPSTPACVVQSRSSKHSLRVKWSLPADDGGIGIEEWELQMALESQWKRQETDVSRGSGSAGTDTDTNTALWTSAYIGNDRVSDIKGLSPGTGYMFRVQARNSAGASAWSPVTVLRTDSSAPKQPGDIQVVSVSPLALSLSWEPPTSDNGARVMEYILEAAFAQSAVPIKRDASSLAIAAAAGVTLSPLNTTTYNWEPLYHGAEPLFTITASMQAASQGSTRQTDKNIENDTHWLVPRRVLCFRVSAKNAIGTSPPSNVCTVEVPSSAPLPPPWVRVEARNASSRVTNATASPARTPQPSSLKAGQQQGRMLSQSGVNVNQRDSILAVPNDAVQISWGAASHIGNAPTAPSSSSSSTQPNSSSSNRQSRKSTSSVPNNNTRPQSTSAQFTYCVEIRELLLDVSTLSTLPIDGNNTTADIPSTLMKKGLPLIDAGAATTLHVSQPLTPGIYHAVRVQSRNDSAQVSPWTRWLLFRTTSASPGRTTALLASVDALTSSSTSSAAIAPPLTSLSPSPQYKKLHSLRILLAAPCENGDRITTYAVQLRHRGPALAPYAGTEVHAVPLACVHTPSTLPLAATEPPSVGEQLPLILLAPPSAIVESIQQQLTDGTVADTVHPTPQRNVMSEVMTHTPHMRVGDRVDALYAEDGLWYAAIIVSHVETHPPATTPADDNNNDEPFVVELTSVGVRVTVPRSMLRAACRVGQPVAYSSSHPLTAAEAATAIQFATSSSNGNEAATRPSTNITRGIISAVTADGYKIDTRMARAHANETTVSSATPAIKLAPWAQAKTKAAVHGNADTESNGNSATLPDVIEVPAAHVVPLPSSTVSSQSADSKTNVNVSQRHPDDHSTNHVQTPHTNNSTSSFGSHATITTPRVSAPLPSLPARKPVPSYYTELHTQYSTTEDWFQPMTVSSATDLSIAPINEQLNAFAASVIAAGGQLSSDQLAAASSRARQSQMNNKSEPSTTDVANDVDTIPLPCVTIHVPKCALPGHTYELRCAAVNAVGRGDWGEPILVTAPDGPPATAPTVRIHSADSNKENETARSAIGNSETNDGINVQLVLPQDADLGTSLRCDPTQLQWVLELADGETSGAANTSNSTTPIPGSTPTPAVSFKRIFGGTLKNARLIRYRDGESILATFSLGAAFGLHPGHAYALRAAVCVQPVLGLSPFSESVLFRTPAAAPAAIQDALTIALVPAPVSLCLAPMPPSVTSASVTERFSQCLMPALTAIEPPSVRDELLLPAMAANYHGSTRSPVQLNTAAISAIVSWSHPTRDNGSTIVGYEAEVRISRSGNPAASTFHPFKLHFDTTSPNTEPRQLRSKSSLDADTAVQYAGPRPILALGALQPSVSYSVRVRPIGVGQQQQLLRGEWSVSATFTAPADVPPRMQPPVLLQATQTFIRVGFLRPTAADGSSNTAVTGYELQRVRVDALEEVMRAASAAARKQPEQTNNPNASPESNPLLNTQAPFSGPPSTLLPYITELLRGESISVKIPHSMLITEHCPRPDAAVPLTVAEEANAAATAIAAGTHSIASSAGVKLGIGSNSSTYTHSAIIAVRIAASSTVGWSDYSDWAVFSSLPHNTASSAMATNVTNKASVISTTTIPTASTAHATDEETAIPNASVVNKRHSANVDKKPNSSTASTHSSTPSLQETRPIATHATPKNQISQGGNASSRTSNSTPRGTSVIAASQFTTPVQASSTSPVSQPQPQLTEADIQRAKARLSEMMSKHHHSSTSQRNSRRSTKCDPCWLNVAFWVLLWILSVCIGFLLRVWAMSNLYE